MAAAVVATPAYLVALTNETLNERLANDNKPLEEATIADVTAAAGAAVVQAYLEKFATKALVKGKAGAEGATGARRVGKEAGLQAGTEALEEGAGYLGGTAGTVRGVDVAQLAEQMLEGAIVGGGLGAGVQAGKEYYTKKQRAELADIVRSDLEARGETPTDEQIGAIVDNMIRIQKEGKADDTGAGTDTGTTKRGVSVSEETEAGGTAGTTTTSTTGGVGGDQGTSGQPGVGEGTQQSALEVPQDLVELYKKMNEADAAAENFNYGSTKRAATMAGKRYLRAMGKYTGTEETTSPQWQAINDAVIKQAEEQQALQDELQQEQSQLNAPSAPQTAEFNEYFKDSKVRDQSGQLIPLFHGTTATGEKGEGITQFKLSKEGSLGSGVYLTPDTNFADTYTGMPSPEMIDAMEAEGKLSQEYIDKLREPYRTGELAPGQVGGNVIPVFADIQNPLIIDTKDSRRDPAVDLLVALGVPQAKAESIVEKANEDKGGITKEVMTRARAKGYDGILQYRNGELSEVVAFSPNQIKSAFNQKPTYRSDILNEPAEKMPAVESFNMQDLPKIGSMSKVFTLKKGTRIFHGAHKTRAEEIKVGGKKLAARPKDKSGGGDLLEGNLIWFGDEDLATRHSKSEIDRGQVEYDKKYGIIREPGEVFSTVTDKDYKLIDQFNYQLSEKEANILNEVLGLPDYKKVSKGDDFRSAAYRAHVYGRSKVDRFRIGRAGEFSDGLARSLKALGYDGLFAESGISLVANKEIVLGMNGEAMQLN
jgi:hypothetical protein